MNSSDSGKKTTAPTQDAFLTRWSRRKQAAADTQLTTHTPADATDCTAAQEVRQLCDADMPALESLTEDADYSGFLSPKVSEALRRQALRKLFHSPAFNIRDGLDDYDEEFTSFAKLGDIVTADMRHQLGEEAQSIAELADAATEAQTQEQNRTTDRRGSQLATNEVEKLSPQATDIEAEQ